MISANVSAFSIGKAVGAGGGGAAPFSLSYAGGAGGGSGGSEGGGGAGGYLEGTITAIPGTAYQVTVGAGGPGVTGYVTGVNGSNTLFGGVATCIGGGGGGRYAWHGNAGGSGGGAGYGGSPGSGTSGQGNDGGWFGTQGSMYGRGGGGGYSQAGQSPNFAYPQRAGDGGNGKIGVSIADPSTVEVCGGGGGFGANMPSLGQGKSGGGNGGLSPQGFQGVNAIVNTGSGGGGGYVGFGSSGSGGSGVIYLKYPVGYTATFSGGVTQTTTTIGSFKHVKITAAGPSDTVTFG